MTVEMVEHDETPEPAYLDPVTEATTNLKEKFPELSDDSRPNFTGLMVPPERLLDIATYLRDELGFDYLSSVTGVDLIDDGKLEAVYHTYSTRKGGGAVVLKVQTNRDDPVIPSLTPMWPGANFQEREAYDMYGIRFEGHPNLRRILLWDGFAGFPLRKDWHEPFFEEEHKPFGSRWPGGKVFRAERRNPYGKNVQYPPGWDPDELDLQSGDTELYAGVSVTREAVPGLKTEKVTVNMGPQHPSTHGVFRMVITLDGETILRLEPVMGYLHRNHEQIGERNTFIQNIPYTDRLDYLSPMNMEHGYVLGVEKLLGVEVPERAEWIRILMTELNRIANHVWALGFLLNDMGAYQTPALYMITEREAIVEFFEATAGSRMMVNYMRFGGLAYDLPGEFRNMPTMQFLDQLINDRLPRFVEVIHTYLTGNEIVRARGMGVGVLSAEEAIAYSTAGPVLRASGVPYDVRRAEPYSYYDKLDFDVAVRYNGDVFDRYLIRVDEVVESIRILQQVLPFLKQTEGAPIFAGKPQYAIRVPGGDAYGRAEAPKGEIGYYIMAKQRSSNADRYHVRSPSFINLTALGKMCEGYKVADVVTILGSIDIVLGDVDR
jgi:NADH-quinone oxidoreductase subunit C/D